MRTYTIGVLAGVVFLLLLISAILLGACSRTRTHTTTTHVENTGTTTTTSVDNVQHGVRGTIIIDKDTEVVVLPAAPSDVDCDSRRLQLMVMTQAIADRTHFKLEWIHFTLEQTETWDQAVVLFTDCKEKQCVPYKMTYEWKGVSHDDGEWNLVEQ